MNIFGRIFEAISNGYGSGVITTVGLLSMLTVVLILAVYEYVVYRVVLHRAFYNRSFNITIAILPFFISTIILCLQSNVVITLGTIGALAIVRFRTAVKDPVDMIYILWSIHTGIVCGCQLYEVAVITSLLVTVILVLFSYINIGGKNYCLVVRLKDSSNEEEFMEFMRRFSKRNRIKSRNFSGKAIDYVIECSVKKPSEFTVSLQNVSCVERFSLMEFDAEDIV